MDDRFEVLVVGAGIVGAACARELAAGGLRVGVLERGAVGGGATAASMGHLLMTDDQPAQVELSRYSLRLWDGWLAAHRADRPEYARCGTIWLAADPDELGAVQAKRAACAGAGVPCALLEPGALYALEPNLRRGLAGGLLVPGDGCVYPPRAAAAFLEEARGAGARLVHGRAVALAEDAAVLSDGRRVGADAVVVACGAATAELLPEVPVRPKKGHLAITDRYPGLIHHELVEIGYVANTHAADRDSVSFNVQARPTGQVLIGSSRQPGVGTPGIDAPILARMIRRAVAFLPCLRGLSCIRTWTGLRPDTPDGLPLIGPHPGRPGVWLATGHEGHGVTAAPATGRLLAAQLLGRPPEIAVEPYLPERLLGGRSGWGAPRPG